MTAYSNALAQLFAPAISGLAEPELIFKTNFGPGVYLDPPSINGSSGNWPHAYVYLRGSDSYGYDMQSSLTAFFGSQTSFFIQQLPNPALTESAKADAEAKLDTLMEAKIQATKIPAEQSDARELYIRLIQRNSASLPIQSPLQVLRRRDDYATTNAIPIPALPSIAWKFKCTLDTGLNGLLSDNADYMILSEFKSGDLRASWPAGAYSSSIGSYRFIVRILKGLSGLYFSTVCDNVAGSAGIYPTGTNAKSGFIFCPFTLGTSAISVGNMVKGKTSGAVARVDFVELRVSTWGGTGKGVLILREIKGQNFTFTNGEILQVSSNNGVNFTDSCTVAEFWSGQESRNLSNPEDKYRLNNTVGGSVPLGVPLQFKFRVVEPIGGRTDIVNGITQGVMTNLATGEKLTLCNFIGGIQAGSQDDPIVRFLPIEPYTSINNGSLPVNIAHRITDLEFYSDYEIEMP